MYSFSVLHNVNRRLVEDLALDQLLADDVLLDDLLRRRRVDVPVDDGRHARGDDLDGRLGVAEAHAAGLPDEDVGEALLGERVDERRERLLRAGGNAAGAHADDDLHVLVGAVAHLHRLLLLPAHLAELFKCQFCHFGFSFEINYRLNF